MILIAVILGYLLGIAPFFYKEIIEKLNNKIEEKEEAKEQKYTEEIIDEWINGVSNQKNQEDLYNEYTTGKEVVKGD